MSTETMQEVACRCCGVATTGPTTRRVTTNPVGHLTPQLDYDLGTCADCLTLEPDRPGVAVRAALRLIRKDESDDTLAAGVFVEAGLDVSFLLYESAVRPEPQRKPWAHVSSDHKGALRAAYVGVLDARVHAASDHNRPMPETVPPPGPRGCLACGVGASASWRPVRTRAFTKGPDYVDGHLCDSCAEVHDSVGALGQPFLERAVMKAQDLSWAETTRVPGLTAWIATKRPPGKAWDWVKVSEALPALDPLMDLQLQVKDLHAALARLERKVG